MDDELPTAQAFGDACFCLTLNRAARTITRRYDAAFRPLGLTSGQFSILAALLQTRPVALSRLAETLGMDRTTLNRNVRPLEKDGLIRTVADAEDARVRGLTLTVLGRAKATEGFPLWQRMQSECAGRMPDRVWTDAKSALSALAG